MAKSPRLSFKGYRFGEALYRNKDSVKSIIALAGTINVVTGFDWKTFLLTLGGAAGALVLKLTLDAVDYYFSEVEL